MPESNKLPEKSIVRDHLVDLITKLPLGEQQALLEELKERSSKLKRKHYRKSLRESVEYTTKDRSEKGFIQNISSGGVFLETRMPFRTGEDIVFNFVSPTDAQKQIKIQGEIIRSSPKGIGVSFKPLNEKQKMLIKSYLEIL